MTTHENAGRAFANRIIGSPTNMGVDPYVQRDAHEALAEMATKLDEIMQRCAQAMYDDAELNTFGCGVNASEAAPALNEVAEIMGMEGPTSRLDRLYDQIGADEEARSLEAEGNG